jgi:hypothetical protein
MMVPHLPAFSSLVALLLLLVGSDACTQIIMGGEGYAYPSEVMSARNM